jgi:small-conductance mechanosensitive channel/CRP-like cAMP-binding protein
VSFVSIVDFAQYNFSLFAGFLFLLLTFALGRFILEEQLRAELRHLSKVIWGFLGVKAVYVLLKFILSKPEEQRWLLGSLGSAAMLLFAFVLVRFSVSMAFWAIRHFRKKPTTKIMKDLLNWGLLLLAVFPILQAQFNLDVASLLAPSAILSVVLGLALQDTLGNLFSGLALRAEQPFEVGDVVDLGEKNQIGQVVQIGWRSIRIQTFRNEILTLPNASISKSTVKNLSQKGLNIGVETEFLISYEMAPNKVRAEVMETIDEIPSIVREPNPFCRVKAFDASAIRYLVRVFTTSVDRYMLVRDELLTRLWYRFERNGIEFGIPRQILHMDSLARQEHLLPPPPSPSLLDSVDLFAPFSPQERNKLAASARERRFGHGEEIISAGEEGHTFYLVASGRVSVRVNTGLELAQLAKGQYFGEMSLLTGEPRTATVIATEDTVLLEFGRECFAEHFANNPQLTESLSKLLATRRMELAKASAASEIPSATVQQSEANRIFTRLRQIFGLRQD